MKGHQATGKTIPCKICGGKYYSLGIHLRSVHNMSASQYRQQYKLKSKQKLHTKKTWRKKLFNKAKKHSIKTMRTVAILAAPVAHKIMRFSQAKWQTISPRLIQAKQHLGIIATTLGSSLKHKINDSLAKNRT